MYYFVVHLDQEICATSVDLQIDSKSVVESLTPDENDFVSILSLDPVYIYRELVNCRQRRTSIISDSDSDEGEAKVASDCGAEVTSDYYSSTNGSGGQCCSHTTNNTGAPSLNDDNNSNS